MGNVLVSQRKERIQPIEYRKRRQPLWKQSSAIRAGAIAAGAPEEPRKPRDRPGSSAFSELQTAREIRPDFEEKIHEKHGPGAEKLKRFGVGACK
jgi:hypothetical protein